MHLESGHVGCVRHDGKDLREDLEQVGLVELLQNGHFQVQISIIYLSLGASRFNILQQLKHNLKAGVVDVAHRVLVRPDDRVKNELEQLRLHLDKGTEAVLVDRLQQQEEIDSVL